MRCLSFSSTIRWRECIISWPVTEAESPFLAIGAVFQLEMIKKEVYL